MGISYNKTKGGGRINRYEQFVSRYGFYINKWEDEKKLLTRRLADYLMASEIKEVEQITSAQRRNLLKILWRHSRYLVVQDAVKLFERDVGVNPNDKEWLSRMDGHIYLYFDQIENKKMKTQIYSGRGLMDRIDWKGFRPDKIRLPSDYATKTQILQWRFANPEQAKSDFFWQFIKKIKIKKWEQLEKLVEYDLIDAIVQDLLFTDTEETDENKHISKSH